MPLPVNDIKKLKELKIEHQQFQEEILSRQNEFDELIRIYRKTNQGSVMKDHYGSLKRNRAVSSSGLVEFRNQNAAVLHGTWQSVWLSALDRQRMIDTAIEEAEEEDFSFDEWRKRYMKWMKHKKSRVMEMMRNMDTNGSGYINNINFIRGVCDSGFNTNDREMYKVVKLFDKGDDRVDYYEFISALHPREQYQPANDAEKIEDEVIREVARCRCCDRFAVHQISDNKYRVRTFSLIDTQDTQGLNRAYGLV